MVCRTSQHLIHKYRLHFVSQVQITKIWVDSASTMQPIVNSSGYKKTSISNHQYCQFMTLANSTSMAPSIGLPPKGAEFCHTLNILLVGHQQCRALLRLYLNYSVAVRSSVVGHRSMVDTQYGLPGFRMFPSKKINSLTAIRVPAGMENSRPVGFLR